MDFKYSLIVSQYYHSWHMFVVEIDGTFTEKARRCVRDLMDYKRHNDEKNEKEYLGDLDEQWCKGPLRRRYNINDSGDIYFINSPWFNSLMRESWEYREAQRRAAAGFKKKAIEEDIQNHHSYQEVKKIVEKHFNIV